MAKEKEKPKGKYEEAYVKAMQGGDVKDMSPKFIEWEEGATIYGKFSHSSLIESELGEYNFYFFDSDIGLVKFSMGRYSDGEVGKMFQPGHLYAVKFLGKEEIKGGKSVNKFQVWEINPPPEKVGQTE